MITTKKARVVKTLGKVAKNAGIIAGSAIVTGYLTTKSKNAGRELVDGVTQLYNITVNTFQKW
jgi:hypothetical protein